MTTEANSQDQNKRTSNADDNDSSKDHEIQVLQERIEELEELVKKGMETNPALGFQTATAMVDHEIASNELATNMQRNSNDITTTITTPPPTIPNEITFPSNLLGKFFVASRNCKQHMRLKLNGTTVEAWEVS